nr:PREDICTED: cytochrome P450 4c3-like isoform X2 [Bemisia tabaci]
MFCTNKFGHIAGMDINIPQLKISHILWICLTGALLIRAFYRRWKHQKIYSFMASLPGPVSLPFLGATYMLFGVSSRNLCSKMKTFVKMYPGVAGFWEREQPHVATSSREVLNAILSSGNVEKFYHYEYFKIGTNSLFSATGTEWRILRNIVNPSFRTNVLMLFDDDLYHHVKIFVNHLQQHVGADGFDIFVLVHFCTIDMICDNMLGSRLVSQENRSKFISDNIIKWAESTFERAFSVLWPDFYFTLSGQEKLRKESIDINHDLICKMIEERIRKRKALREESQQSENSRIYIDILLDNVDAGVLTKDQITSEILEIVVAGSITTAITNAWVFKLLALYPDIQERAYQEIKENCVEGEVRLSDLSKFVYTEMIIKETLRHFGPPMAGRYITEDLQVDDKMTIPAGMNIFICLHELHHDPKYWQRPGEFYPDHFSPANEKARPKGAFSPFMGGPRVCPGSKYAMRSMKFLVASTLSQYKFSTDEKPADDLRDMDYRLVFMLFPTSGFNVKIQQR